MKFRYYIYYKYPYFSLYDRKKKKVHYTSLSFYTMYSYLKKHNYNLEDVHIKSMSLHDFFRDYVYFDEENEKL